MSFYVQILTRIEYTKSHKNLKKEVSVSNAKIPDMPPMHSNFFESKNPAVP